jgi:hypothetical protein
VLVLLLGLVNVVVTILLEIEEGVEDGKYDVDKT